MGKIVIVCVNIGQIYHKNNIIAKYLPQRTRKDYYSIQQMSFGNDTLSTFKIHASHHQAHGTGRRKDRAHNLIVDNGRYIIAFEKALRYRGRGSIGIAGTQNEIGIFHLIFF